VVLILLLGAARHRLEPFLEPSPPPVPVSIDPTRFGRLDLNRATIPELESLPRIGPRLAERIVAHRETHGPFAAVEDLEQVRGIGPVTVQRLASLVRVDARVATPAAAADH
jgi:competence protein ComEA